MSADKKGISWKADTTHDGCYILETEDSFFWVDTNLGEECISFSSRDDDSHLFQLNLLRHEWKLEGGGDVRAFLVEKQWIAQVHGLPSEPQKTLNTIFKILAEYF